ncbi:hypothetical protein [Roseiarcus sp.]|uniref:hypothetical protein n=1 Tax=Roseiarcus sp. TaxID=1969460 RepID=UPI003F96D9A0
MTSGIGFETRVKRFRAQPSPHFQMSPKVSVKALFWLNNSALDCDRLQDSPDQTR